MKKLGKFSKTLLSLLLAIGMALMPIGCKKNGGGSPNGDGDGDNGSGTGSTPSAVSVTLDKSTLDLIVEGTGKLTATYTTTEGYSLSFSSSAESVATVDSSGNVTGKSEGNATVTATYGNGTDSVTATCAVTVGFKGQVPTLALSGLDTDKTLNMPAGSTHQLNPVVTFNSKEYTDATVTYKSSNEAAVSVSDLGVIKAEGGAGSTANIEVKATWRNKATNAETVKVAITADTEILINGGNVDTLDLYTVASHGDVSDYKTGETLVLTGRLDGQSAVPQAKIASGDAYINLTGGDGTYQVTQKAYVPDGENAPVIKVWIGEEADPDDVKEITVNVKRPVATAAAINYFSQIDGTFLKKSGESFTATSIIKEVFGASTNDSDIKDIYQDGDKVDLNNLQDGAIMNLDVESDAPTQTTLKIGTAQVVWEIPVTAATKFLHTPQDLTLFDIKSADQAIDGYYEMVCDIDATGIVPQTLYKQWNDIYEGANRSAANVKGFIGHFNGNGNVIKNLDMAAKQIAGQTWGVNNNRCSTTGLFGVLQGGAVVENVAFENVAANYGSVIAFATNSKTDDILVRNVYVKVAAGTTHMRGIFHDINNADKLTTLQNVVIDFQTATTTPNFGSTSNSDGTNFGALAGYKPEQLLKAHNETKNIFVLSPYWVMRGDSGQVGYAVNETKALDGTELTDDKLAADKGVRLNFLKRYDYAIDMIADKAKNTDWLATFDTNYWDTSTGVPVWKAIGMQAIEIYGAGYSADDETFYRNGQKLELDGDITSVKFNGGTYNSMPTFVLKNANLSTAAWNTATIAQGLDVYLNGSSDKVADLNGFNVVQFEIETSAGLTYVISTNLYSKVIMTATDLATVFNYNKDENAGASGELDGYYVLGRNINAAEIDADGNKLTEKQLIKVIPDAKDLDRTFLGIFDGNGYTISNLDLSGNWNEDLSGSKAGTGLLGGYISGNAVVRNVAFDNVDASLGTIFGFKVLSGDSSSGSGKNIAQFANIYVKTSKKTKRMMGLFAVVDTSKGIFYTETKNIVVEYLTDEADDYSFYNGTTFYAMYKGAYDTSGISGIGVGAFIGAANPMSRAGGQRVSNCFVISNNAVCYNGKSYCGANETVGNMTAWEGKYLNVASNVVSVYRYGSRSEMSDKKQDNTDNGSLASFNAAYWTVGDDGVPTWNSLPVNG